MISLFNSKQELFKTIQDKNRVNFKQFFSREDRK